MLMNQSILFSSKVSLPESGVSADSAADDYHKEQDLCIITVSIQYRCAGL